MKQTLEKYVEMPIDPLYGGDLESERASGRRILALIRRSFERFSADAEDLKQEVQLKMYRQACTSYAKSLEWLYWHVADLPAAAGFLGYPLGYLESLCTKQVCLDHDKKLKTAMRNAVIESLDAAQNSVHEPRDRRLLADQRTIGKIELKRFIKTLNLKERQALLLREVDGVTYEEGSQIMGVPLNSFRRYVHDARQKAQKWLHDRERDPGNNERG